MWPGFSVTIAVVEPGRKSIAHGLSNVATGAAVKGGSAGDAGAAPSLFLVVADEPQAARTSSSAVSMVRILMTAAPFGRL
jgi:hypothetical protein